MSLARARCPRLLCTPTHRQIARSNRASPRISRSRFGNMRPSGWERARGKAGFRMLQKVAKSDSSSEVRSQVAFALSVSHEPEALNEMIRLAKEDESSHVRGQALFWLAQKAGQKAMGAITGAIENDPDTEVKKKAVFALSQLPKDEGVPKLIEVAKTNRNREVRKQAMFWLGQSNDPRALEFFEQVLAR